ncbi:SIP domain-containing protein [Microbacterium indicum]|uniref:SIP domain-containing protein n=1 Tax=Microbacterium indicum TaxID=358100 RepID=UPI00041C557F|nr:SIP domain-containing protein [Microbacterium indicum]
MTAVSLAETHDDITCRSRRHARAQHLVTADEHSLVDLELFLATLPLCATGRVFVEVPDATWVSDLAVPARMSVTWLDRSARRGEPGTGRFCGTGLALTRAVTAYADEVICDEHAPTITLLAGFVATADIVDHLTSRRGVDRARIMTTPEVAAYL